MKLRDGERLELDGVFMGGDRGVLLRVFDPRWWQLWRWWSWWRAGAENRVELRLTFHTTAGPVTVNVLAMRHDDSLPRVPSPRAFKETDEAPK